mmetsp:Transcript_5204/g.5933  ORF Transcript_5204/g.5933 Transcript_5204/m.5933 type:complete len:550 (+) Transcript_5204:94-1743(+)|eukprot:CAMPEP_0194441378 /NCGR_PEP_ID=MMETSP0176-20130528/121279_1 /TAXON_ID=216777 /ORGANISM="Proboscia alata, Strain PI-D3" /LENGTH=549 /DNA_ID=CAMNT_0039266665 /DNA_START=21 /DNA_END=1670 /DNA_ORIENTATION=+
MATEQAAETSKLLEKDENDDIAISTLRIRSSSENDCDGEGEVGFVVGLEGKNKLNSYRTQIRLIRAHRKATMATTPIINNLGFDPFRVGGEGENERRNILRTASEPFKKTELSPKANEAKSDRVALIASTDNGNGVKQVSSRDRWKRSVNLIKATNIVTRKVKLENKVGTPVTDLKDGDPLKVISLASQRSLRCFGRAQSHVRLSKQSDYTSVRGAFDEVLIPSAEGVLKFDATSPSATHPSFKVQQPAFKCHELFNEDFARIRAAFNISERQFYAVLGLQERRAESSFSVISSGDASGKSPAFFFLPSGQRFILKSCTERDVKTLTAIRRRYTNYVESCNIDGKNESLLPRYIGLYRFEFEATDIPDVTLVIMTNFFAGSYVIHQKYDLKGSRYKRTASVKERLKKTPVFKDLDWIANGRKLTFPTEEDVESMLKRLDNDAAFLSYNKLIDYSLLVGVHEIGNSPIKSRQDDICKEKMSVVRSVSKSEVRYFGIVDILTPYVLQKKAETLFAGTLMCRPDISCQPPNKYHQRFVEFCKSDVLACDAEP